MKDLEEINRLTSSMLLSRSLSSMHGLICDFPFVGNRMRVEVSEETECLCGEESASGRSTAVIIIPIPRLTLCFHLILHFRLS